MGVNFKKLFKEYRLAVSIIGAILLVLLMTALSVALYIRDGTSRLDLSRPGYEGVRGQVEKKESFPAFSSTGPIDAASVKEFQKLYKKQTDTLNHFSSFKEKTLEDNQLLVAPRPQ